MRRQRASSQGSFDLFLDTVCNTFGGILFIAILVAVQIRQTEGEVEPAHEYSPEEIVQMQQRLESLLSEIESAKIVLQAIEQTMPKPTLEKDRILLETYTTLLEQIETLTEPKNELLSLYLAQVHLNADLEDKFKKLEELIDRLNVDEKDLEEALRKLQANKELAERELQALQKDMKDLAEKIRKKESLLADKKNESKKGRQEVLHLPKLKTADTSKRPAHLVLRYNRLYVVKNSTEFDRRGLPSNYWGTPYQTHGRSIDETQASVSMIRNLIDSYSPQSNYLSFTIYPDSFERFYVVRNIAIEKGFEYEITPSEYSAVWVFGEGEGETMVQ